MVSEQSDDFSILGDVDFFCGGNLGKARHCHNITCQDYYEACTCRNLNLSYGYGEILGGAKLFRIVGEGLLCFRNADGEFSKAQGG